MKKQNKSRPFVVVWGIAGILLPAAPVRATGPTAQLVKDPPGDAVIRMTDEDGDGPCDPQTQGLPDLAEMKLGRFAPADPAADLFAGNWSNSGTFLRFDMVFSGLANPPGPLGFDDVYPTYAPFQYGPNPVYGWVELDMDVDVDTGGELAFPENRYLGNVARFGGKPAGPPFVDRVAESEADFDNNVLTAPYVDRSGEEFHVAFIAEDIDAITIVQEQSGGDPAIFEEGEVWIVEGRHFHRAHGFSQFALMCSWSEGEYMPSVKMRFAHDLQLNQTTISLVYPLTNSAAATMIGPSEPVENEDGCDDNQNSVEEALDDLKFSATNAFILDRLNPNFQLLAEWEFKTVADHVGPAVWRIETLLGTAYSQPQPGSGPYVWTDVWPNPKFGDFDGNGVVNGTDSARFYDFLETHDGLPDWDDDGDPFNGEITLSNYARNFSLFDTNHDGVINPNDLLLRGDMDINGIVDVADVDDFAQGLLDPAGYQATHQGIDPRPRGDMNGDAQLDGADIADFAAVVLDTAVGRQSNPEGPKAPMVIE